MFRGLLLAILIAATAGCMQQAVKDNEPTYQASQMGASNPVQQLADADPLAAEDCGVASLDCFENNQQGDPLAQELPVQSSPEPVISQAPEPQPPSVIDNTERPTDQGQYYGIRIRQEQQNILFVLDTSGSMADLNEGTGMTPLLIGAAAQLSRNSDKLRALAAIAMPLAMRQVSKLNSAKKELTKTIESLAPDTRFNIITFGETPLVWQNDLITADTLNKNSAIAFINALNGRGGTPALAALQQAFSFTDADTIFFVSDGIPTDSSTQRIINEVQTINNDYRVKINTIGLGGDQDAGFMTRLARNNGGTYVRR